MQISDKGQNYLTFLKPNDVAKVCGVRDFF